jgi:hypothetical protein
MLVRLSLVALAFVALALFVMQPALAADQKDKESTHEGKVVKAGNGQLMMTDLTGANRHTHKVAADAKITLDGKEAKLEDLKEGYNVKVTFTGSGDKDTTATKIDARSKAGAK